MKLSEELKHWGYHSSISDEGKKQHLEMAERAEQLQADRDALVAVLRLLNEPIAYCAYPGFEKDDAYSRVEMMREAYQALSEELRELIDE